MKGRHFQKWKKKKKIKKKEEGDRGERKRLGTGKEKKQENKKQTYMA